MAVRSPEPIKVFQEVALNHSRLLEEQATQLADRGLLRNRRYTKTVKLLLQDVREESTFTEQLQADVLMTSPPYGDNQTTVPYGQHSYLPLQWIGISDLPATTLSDCQKLLPDAYALDRLSLGGSRVGADKIENSIVKQSEALERMVKALRSQHPTLRRKLLAYANDLDKSLDAITRRLRPGAFMFWTLGERRVGGNSIPLTEIVREMLEQRGVSHIHTLQRQIPGNAKRMALRNDRGVTMRDESVLVMQAPAPLD
jgi:site-specific DNA-methyltransferase (cytosine-N4-specific)